MSKLLIHGHSCCEIRTNNSSLICDPWLLGSAYWRSWWNFPNPIGIDELINSWRLQENVFIYITHLHWDHFHGPTLKKIARSIKHSQFLIPLTPETRMINDLKNVLPTSAIREIKHAKTIRLAKGLEVTSFQSGPIGSDSALAIKAGETTILNLNDSKIYKNSLKHLLSIIDEPSYTLRSHASANSRCCIKYLKPDSISSAKDKRKEDYSSEFLENCYAANSKNAIPFASNMAHLHKETFKYNSILNFADEVIDFYNHNSQRYPGMNCFQVLPGEEIDLLSHELQNVRHVTRELLSQNSKNKILKNYQSQKQSTLSLQYKKEQQATAKVKSIEKYFNSIISQTPWILRRMLKDHVCIEAKSRTRSEFFTLNFTSRTIERREHLHQRDNDITIKVCAYVINDVCIQSHWNSLGVSKRLEIIQLKPNKTYLLFNIICNSIESGGGISIRNLFKPRTLAVWYSRRREIIDLLSIASKVFKNDQFSGRVDAL